MRSFTLLFFLSFLLFQCTNNNVQKNKEKVKGSKALTSIDPYLVVLGVAQDAGYPQAACQKKCCEAVWKNPALKRMVSCLGLVDPISKEQWLFDATPDFPDQLTLLNQTAQQPINTLPNGIFLTHAHIGHYTGLIHLGREVIGAKSVKVFCMPRMADYLTNNGPWSQLVKLQNIAINRIQEGQAIRLNKRISIIPFLVPHRDEYSETVGFKIKTTDKSAIFIPDINKWQDWETDIKKLIEENDVAFLDGTFFKNGEIPNRDMSAIPHPFIEESLEYFKDLSLEDKSKIHFIHFNHTNPVLWNEASKVEVLEEGFKIANEKIKVHL